MEKLSKQDLVELAKQADKDQVALSDFGTFLNEKDLEARADKSGVYLLSELNESDEERAEKKAKKEAEAAEKKAKKEAEAAEKKAKKEAEAAEKKAKKEA